MVKENKVTDLNSLLLQELYDEGLTLEDVCECCSVLLHTYDKIDDANGRP